MATRNTLPPLGHSLVRNALRMAAILAIALAVHMMTDWVIDRSETLSPGSQTLMLTSILALMLLSYALLISIPFVPGIEIGITLILMRGAPIAPYVYSATVVGLVLSYLVGRYMPYRWIQRMMLDLRLTRASDLLERTEHLTSDQRIDLLCDRLPRWLGPHMVRWRYIAVAILINVPGNALIGGGGGICLMAGLSRLFNPLGTIITILLAVSPVPLAVWVFGIEFIK